MDAKDKVMLEMAYIILNEYPETDDRYAVALNAINTYFPDEDVEQHV